MVLICFGFVIRESSWYKRGEEMDNDLISRSELKKAVEKSFKHNLNGYDALLISEIDEFIDNAPTVEPEIYITAQDYDVYLEGYKQGKKDFDRPQGEWIRTRTGSFDCPFCHRLFETRDNFCGYCGADLRGSTE